MILIAILSALVLASAIGSVAYVIGAKQQAGPTRELAAAVRVLDRILAYDDSVTALSQPLRDEAKKVTSNYYKELTK